MKHFKTAIIGTSLLLWAGVASAQTAGTSGYITVTPKSNDGSASFHGHLVGSDTLNELMDELIADMIVDGDLSGSVTVGNVGYIAYEGVGSSIGQRWAEGSPNVAAGDPQCTPNDGNGSGEGNPGCEEITPMSRQLNSAICDDDLQSGSETASFAAAGSANHNYEAEGLAVCLDGVVVLTDNHSLGEYGDSTGACDSFNFGAGGAAGQSDNTGVAGAANTFVDHGVGNLNDGSDAANNTIDLTGDGVTADDYTLGGGALSGTSNDWKDVLRLIYTGCTNAGASLSTCADSDDRVARCGAPARIKLMQSWGKIFEGTDCGSAGNACDNAGTPADGGLRQVYRRDDGSGTSGSFLELLGVAKNPQNLVQRGSILSGTPPAITVMPHFIAFCDGGQTEAFVPTGFDGSGTPTFDQGDPVRKPCKPEDDLCAYDGKSPVVRSIRSTIAPDPADPSITGYPKYQCTKGLFARKGYISGTTLKVCPDGTAPNAAGCKFPYYDTPVTHVKNFDCMNSQISRPSTLPSTVDGRAYNFVMHFSDGTLRKVTGSGVTTLPQVASWRQNMAVLSTSSVPPGSSGFQFGPSAPGDYVCNEDDSTRNIGCLVAHTTCALGFAGREAAYSASNSDHLLQEPVQLFDHSSSDSEIIAGTYKFSRRLWLNAIDGFENISNDCLNRGGNINECADEVDIATEFYNYGTAGNRIAPLCTQLGFIPLPLSSTPGVGSSECTGAMNAGATNNVCGAPDVQAHSACAPL